jgi:RHH-type proline utilization regulon transcriptional repressor/proline dehydrogenase/delta 1-pyrroline-5-carboxylate dehydrogenase
LSHRRPSFFVRFCRRMHDRIMIMEKAASIEQEIRRIGFGIYSSVTDVPAAFDTRRWIGRILQWAMTNEDFRIRLFHFIDVLPSLKTDDLVIRLLHEYFGGETDIPRLIAGGVARISRKGFLPHITARVIRKGMESMARQFIAGRNPEDAQAALRSLREQGADFSVDLLGEAAVSDREAAEYTERYGALAEFLHAAFGLREKGSAFAGPDISVKVSSFYSRLDPMDWEGSLRKTADGLRPVMRKAKELGISVTFDMEHYYYKDLIMAVFKRLSDEEEFHNLPFMGIAIQSYLRDAEDDLKDLIRWAKERRRKIAVRLVKGAYWDYEIVVNRQKGWPVPVFRNKEETDLNFEKLTRLLLENTGYIRPAVATHNIRSMCTAIALADSLGIPANAFEFQMLYGMAEPLRKPLHEMGHAVRVYVPVGELLPGMAYLVRRLLENTSNASFLRRSFSDKTSFEDLIKQPSEKSETLVRSAPEDQFKNEPLLDFSNPSNREKMTETVRSGGESPQGTYPLLIGSREVRTSHQILSLNPARPDETIGRVSSASKKEADDAVAAALSAREVWGKTPPSDRASYLFKAAQQIRQRRFELAALEVFEVGKTWREADADVAEAIDYLEYYGRDMLRLGSPMHLGEYPGEENGYLYRPRGIGVVISPWNFPLAIAAGMASAAIVTGNCAILKPSSLSPVTAYKLVEIFAQIGLPDGVLQFLPGPGIEVGEYLVSHPAIDFIAFTGSKEIGLRIVNIAGETTEKQRSVKKVIAEMGGKNAVILDETADLEEAVRGVLESAMDYQGQKCSACSRAIVIGNIFDTFSRRLVEAAESIRIGPPEEPGNAMGPVIDRAALEKIMGYIEIGKEEGKLLFEGKAGTGGYFLGPVIFSDVAPESRIATEEIFGPVLALMRARDIDEAIRIANSSSYALTGGLYSRSPANILKAKSDFRVGNLYINRKITGALVGRQPFGGFGMSGVGSKAGGPDYLIQFLHPVSVSENTLRRGFAPLADRSGRLF